jgi:two-component system, LytTR family, response regulator
MVKLVIIEDEKEVLSSLIKIIDDYCQDICIEGTASDFNSARELLVNAKPDIALLDINLPGGNTFDVLRSLPVIGFKVIFITAFEEFAIQAIKFSAIDYLLKPVDPTELVTAIHQAAKTIEEENYKMKLEAFFRNIGKSAHDNKVIVLKTSESIHIVEVHDIMRCESDSSYTTFFLTDGQKILISRPLKEYDEMLSSCNFFRLHQSHLVNMKYVKKFEKTDGGYVVMRDGSSVPVSLRKRDALIHAIETLAGK